MRMTEKQELDSLLTVIEDELIIENEAGDFELAVGHILAAGGRFASLGKFLGTVDAQQSGAVGLSDDAGPCLTKHFVAVGVVTVMMGVEDVANRFIRGFLDGLDHVAGLLGEVGVDDGDIIFKDDPDIIAAAERDVRSFGADGGITEENAGRNFFDFVELKLGNVIDRASRSHTKPDQER